MSKSTMSTSNTTPYPTPTPVHGAFLRALMFVLFWSFAVLNWFLYVGSAFSSGIFFKKDTEQEQLRAAISRDRFWNLSKQPIKGFEHAFFKVRNGLKLHYITNRRSSNPTAKKGGNLVIFIHGFPDSCMVWRHILQEPGIPHDNARLVCLDLPNYGGSDHFQRADTAVLEAVTQFIVAMKEEHEEAAGLENNEFNTIIVAHDWGCAIGFRLAAEAPALADRFILTNGPHVGLSLANKDRIINSATKIFKQFQESPQKNFKCLGKTIKTLRPLLSQVIKFGYMFVFQLPRPMVSYLAYGGNYTLLRGIAKTSHGKSTGEVNIEDCLAAMNGPGIIEVDTRTAGGEGYGSTVQHRAASAGSPWYHQTAYYRDSLAFQKWDKSLETIADLYNLESESSASANVSPIRRRSSSSASSTFFTEQYNGALKAPCTVVWGEKDFAVGKEVCLDGIGDYLARGSEVILLPRSSHWVPVEKEGRAALVKVISLCAGAAVDNMPVYMAKDVGDIYPGANSMVRK